MSEFIYPGECGACERDFSKAAAKGGGALNDKGLCSTCNPRFALSDEDIAELELEERIHAEIYGQAQGCGA